MATKLNKRPLTINEVVIQKNQVINGTIKVPSGINGYELGTALTSDDGVEFKSYPFYSSSATYSTNDMVFHKGKQYKAKQGTSGNEPTTSDTTNWEDLGVFELRGILLEGVSTDNEVVAVLITGKVKKSNLKAYDDSMGFSAFKNKIVVV